MNNIKSKLSDKVVHLEASAIREIFKLLGKPGIISFAGGAPAPEMFPTDRLAEIARNVIRDQGSVALQYGVTEGYAPLVEWVKTRLLSQGIGNPETDGYITVSGGQQGIDLAAHSLINPGDGVVCEQPGFIGGLNTFRSYNAELVGVPVQDDGMDMDELKNILKAKKIKLIYTIPTFQNPTGITMSLEKRKRLLELASRYDLMILEDNPYQDLRFAGEPVATLKSMDTEGRVVYCGSFTKILAPGVRVGFVCAPNELLEKMIICKQTSDVHTNVVGQMLVYEYVTQNSIDEHIANLCALYGKRCRKMLECIENYFPKEVTFTRPQGGLFIFCTMPEKYDSKEIMQMALQKNVAFVPGATTMVDDKKKCSSFRLNYSNMSSEKIEIGIKLLGSVLYSAMNG